MLLIKAQEDLVIALNLVIGPEDHTKFELPMQLGVRDLTAQQDSKLQFTDREIGLIKLAVVEELAKATIWNGFRRAIEARTEAIMDEKMIVVTLDKTYLWNSVYAYSEFILTLKTSDNLTIAFLPVTF